jgi:3-hydroxybutyryl-CoA dehydrogenase
MNIAIKGNQHSIDLVVKMNPAFNWVVVNDISQLQNPEAIDLFVNLSENAGEENYHTVSIPTFINSVCFTLKEKNHPQSIVRINGWNGFLERDTWEVAGEISEIHSSFLKAINKKNITVADEAGMVSARVICMIINEAYFAMEDGISTPEEIDIAMKLGTNYPKGPFEWKAQIGINPIYSLLETLSNTDSKYTPSILLKTEAEKK